MQEEIEYNEVLRYNQEVLQLQLHDEIVENRASFRVLCGKQKQLEDCLIQR